MLVAKKSARFYDEKLKAEINADRIAHGKKLLKEKDEKENQDDNDGNPGSGKSRSKALQI